MPMFLNVIKSWVLSWVFSEVRKLWSDDRVKSIAQDAITWAEASTGNNKDKAQVAKNELLDTAKELGISISKSAAEMIIEKAVQRYLK